MTENEIKLAEQMWENGSTMGEIARVLPYKEYKSLGELRKLKQNGVLKGRSGKTKAKTWGRVVEAYNGGITNPYELAKMFNTTKDTINTILVNSGVRRKRPKHNYKNTVMSQKTLLVVEDLKNGMESVDIQKKYGITKQWVSLIKIKYLGGKNGK